MTSAKATVRPVPTPLDAAPEPLAAERTYRPDGALSQLAPLAGDRLASDDVGLPTEHGGLAAGGAAPLVSRNTHGGGRGRDTRRERPLQPRIPILPVTSPSPSPSQAAPPVVARRWPAAVTRVSWSLRHDLDVSGWLYQGRWLGSIGRAVGWWIGDWLRYGNARYGERYASAARVTGYDRQTLMNMVYVASRIEVSRRREKLSFSHHAEVAALPAVEQDRWLGLAEYEGLSVRSLRELVRHDRQLADQGAAPGEAPPPAPDGPSRLGPSDASAPEAVCPVCGHRFAVGG
jgi:hypothetical protein